MRPHPVSCLGEHKGRHERDKAILICVSTTLPLGGVGGEESPENSRARMVGQGWRAAGVSQRGLALSPAQEALEGPSAALASQRSQRVPLPTLGRAGVMCAERWTATFLLYACTLLSHALDACICGRANDLRRHIPSPMQSDSQRPVQRLEGSEKKKGHGEERDAAWGRGVGERAPWPCMTLHRIAFAPHGLTACCCATPSPFAGGQRAQVLAGRPSWLASPRATDHADRVLRAAQQPSPPGTAGGLAAFCVRLQTRSETGQGLLLCIARPAAAVCTSGSRSLAAQVSRPRPIN